jgi:hypothetical protein
MIEILSAFSLISLLLAAGFNALEHYQQKRLEKGRKQLEQTWEKDRDRT